MKIEYVLLLALTIGSVAKFAQPIFTHATAALQRVVVLEDANDDERPQPHLPQMRK